MAIISKNVKVRTSGMAPHANFMKSAHHPDVSFIVAAYNIAPFIKAAVRSTLQQTGVEVEVIVVDDASSDGTTETLAALADEDPRVVHIRRDKASGGPSVPRNEAMNRAKGTWLAILDGDDLITPERTRRLIDLAETASADMVADNFERFCTESQPAGATMIPRGEQPYAFLVDVSSFIMGNSGFGRSNFTLGAIKPMLRTDFVRANGIGYMEDVPNGEDYLMCLECLLEGGRFVVTSESFYKYRMRPGSQSWRISEEDIDRLLRAHAEAGIEARLRGDADAETAMRFYLRTLKRAQAFIRIVDDAKRWELVQAIYATVSQPDIWPLVMRFGAEALAKRVWKPA